MRVMRSIAFEKLFPWGPQNADGTIETQIPQPYDSEIYIFSKEKSV